MRKFLSLLVLMFLLSVPIVAHGETISVAPGELTRALSRAEDGDVLLLSGGTYAEPQENFPLCICAGVTIQAQAGETVIIDAPAFQSAFRVEADDVKLRDLEIRFRRTGIYALGDGMIVENCSILLADTAWRTSSCGCWFGGIENATFRNCAFTDCGICMAGPPLSETSHLVPVLTGLFEVGEERSFFTTHTIENCTVNGKPLFYAVSQPTVTVPAGAGEIIVADCGEVLVCDADVSRASMGMEIVYCDHVRVENSKADECGVFGIYFAKLQSGEMVDCTSRGTNHGLDIRASENITLLRCSADWCDQGLFFSHVDNGLMMDCTVTSTGQGYFFAGGNHCQVYRCQAIDCENGMNIQKENDVLVSDCILRSCTICAARLDGSPTVFVNNLLEDNWVGIMAYGEVPFQLVDNTVRGTGSCGLYLRDIAYSRICGNVIEESQKSAVEAIGEMSGTLLAGNQIDGEIACSKGAALRMAEELG